MMASGRNASYKLLYRKINISADTIFKLEEVEVFADFDILEEFCGHLPFLLGEGGKKVITVTEAVDLESLNQFIKALYLGTLDNDVSFNTLIQVRKLGALFKSDDVMELCDEKVQATEDNCHTLLQELPTDSPGHKAALLFTIRNLKALIDTGKTLIWGLGAWKGVLEYCRTHIGNMPVPTEKLHESVKRWREAEGNVEKDEDFVEMVKLMDKSFLYDVVSPNNLLNDKLFKEVSTHLHYRRDRLQTPNNQSSSSARNNGTCSPGSQLRFGEHAEVAVIPRRRGSTRRVANGQQGTSNSVFGTLTNGDLEPTPAPNEETRSQRKRPSTTRDADQNESSRPKKLPRGRPKKSTLKSKVMIAKATPRKTIHGTVIARPLPSETKVARTFKQLTTLLKTVKRGGRILLTEGTFKGQLKLKLPDGVTISGMGRRTIVTADQEDYIWDALQANGKDCIIEKIHFFKPSTTGYDHRIEPKHDGTTRRRGLWTCGSKLTVRDCQFTRTCLEIAVCTDSKFHGLTFDSCYFGIFLTIESSAIAINKITFESVAIGISCYGRDISMTGLTMTNVGTGVDIQAEEDVHSGNDNKVFKMTYAFNPEDTSRDQIAVCVNGGERNRLEGITCEGYVPVTSKSRKAKRFGVLISNHKDIHTRKAKDNKVRSGSGAPVSITGLPRINTLQSWVE